MCGCYDVSSNETYNTKKCLPQVDLKAHTTVLSTASRTVLSQTFVNPSSATNVKECRYIFPLYDGVSVVGFTCQIGSRIINGLVKEKAKAKEEYGAAVERGETAGLLEQGTTSDVFIISLGNIPAGEKLFVTITYIGELKHDVGEDGIRFTIPTSISPRYGQVGMDQINSTVLKGCIAITVDVIMPEDSPLQEDSGKPKALLETHPTIPKQRALMATLVMKGPVQQSKPEVIFVADQSGSMSGVKSRTLVSALRIFLRSLPVGIKFNICYFGSYHSLLFPRSRVYNQTSLEDALRSLDELDGKCGGTATLAAVRASVKSRDNTQPLSIILATDGDIWQQQDLFDYLNDAVASSKKTLRVFALGIGNSVSSGLIEGVARAGNGFAQSVGEEERLDGKVIRMLRGALTPDYGAFTMEIEYQKDDGEDAFVMVERVSDSLKLLELDGDDWLDTQLGHDPSVSAGTTIGGKEDEKVLYTSGLARYNYLPAVPAPKLLQTPQHFPPLYSFSRTNVYVLISPEAAVGTIKSVILKGSSAEKPLQLEISIEVLSEPGKTIHQLAVKKAIVELEDGHGWLLHTKDEKGVLVKDKHSTQFPSMLEREAVRLGTQYQTAGKFTSFVATETDPEILAASHASRKSATSSRIFKSRSPMPASNAFFTSTTSTQQPSTTSDEESANESYSKARKSAPYIPQPAKKRKMKSIRKSIGGMPAHKKIASMGRNASPSEVGTTAEETNLLQKIIALQNFKGYWNLDGPLLKVVGLSVQHKAPQGVDLKVWATLLAITFLEGTMASDKESWEMVVEKARDWLNDKQEGEDGLFKEKWTLAGQLVMGAA